MIERRTVADEGATCQVYRAYIVNAEGRFINVHELYCRSDEEAIDQARNLAGKYAVELWVRDRKIADIPAP